MKDYYKVLKSCPLFMEVDEKDIKELLSCLNAKEYEAQKDEFVFRAGDKPKYIGVVLSGSVYIIQEDYWGNRTILSNIQPGGLFAESFSLAKSKVFPVSAKASMPSKLLLINCEKILTTCSSSCVFHSKLIENLLKILANKNIMLTRKIGHITKKTTQEKVLSFLSEFAVFSGSESFEIPFNRQEMADYISVERSALSKTLSKMREEGIIKFHKNKFEICKN